MPLLIILNGFLSLISPMFWLMFSINELLVKKTPFLEACVVTLSGYTLTIVLIFIINLISSTPPEQGDT